MATTPAILTSALFFTQLTYMYPLKYIIGTHGIALALSPLIVMAFIYYILLPFPERAVGITMAMLVAAVTLGVFTVLAVTAYHVVPASLNSHDFLT